MATGDVLFSKDLDDNRSEIWDDTALIEAYDEAVKSMKAQIAVQLGEEQQAVNQSTDKKKHKKKRKHKNKVKASQQGDGGSVSQVHSWKIGDACRAVFTQDGQIYEAVIIAVNSDEQTCQVRYRGYGNEEEHVLDDLLLSKEHSVGTKSISGPPSECDSMDWSNPGSAGPRGAGCPSSRHGNMGRGMGRGWTGPYPPFPSMPPMPPPHSMPDFMPPMMPPLFPPMMGGASMMGGIPPLGPMPSMGPNSASMPDIPAPPPILDDIEGLENDKEALHSMLISWYMSGYHTGFYQGLKQSKKSQPVRTPTDSKPEPTPSPQKDQDR